MYKVVILNQIELKFYYFCLVWFVFRAQSDLSQNNSYPNDITYSSSNLQENQSSNSSAQCNEIPVLVSQTKNHQTTQQVRFFKKNFSLK